MVTRGVAGAGGAGVVARGVASAGGAGMVTGGVAGASDGTVAGGTIMDTVLEVADGGGASGVARI